MLRLASCFCAVLLAAPLRAGVVDAPPPTSDPATNRANLQAAIDKAGSDGAGLVRLPAGTYALDRPARLDSAPNPFASVALVGMGRGLSILKPAPGRMYDVLAVGIDRKPNGRGLTPDHFPPTDGVLDDTARGRWGFRTLADNHLSQSGGHLDMGPGASRQYATTRALTLDLAVLFPDASTFDAPLAGLVEQGHGRPISVLADPYGVRVLVTTRGPDASDPESQSDRTFYLAPYGPGVKLQPGLHRITVQVDLDSDAMIAGWIQGPNDPRGLRCRVVGPAATQPAPKAGESFFANRHSTFNVGTNNETAAGANQGVGAIRDTTTFGLKLTATALYRADSDGPARVDGKALTDAVRYFSDEPDLVGYLTGATPPAQACADRLVGVRGRYMASEGWGESGMWVLDNARHSSAYPYRGSRIEGITVQGWDAYRGNALAVGCVLNLDVDRCDFSGGASGIASVPFGTSYPLSIRRSSSGGSHAAVRLSGVSTAVLEDVQLAGEYRVGVDLSYGSCDLVRLFSSHWGRPDYGVRALYATFTARGLSLDNEDPRGGGSQVADLYIVPQLSQAIAANLRLEGIDTVYCAPGAAKLLLGGPPAGSPLRAQMGAATVEAKAFAVHNDSAFRAAIRVLPSAAGLWRDAGIELSAQTPAPYVPFEGPALGRPAAVDTTGAIAAPK